MKIVLGLVLGFLVPDYRRREFQSYSSVLQIPDLQLGVIQSDPAFIREAQQRFPNAEFHSIESPRNFLRGRRPELDAVVYSAEGGAAWTLIYPSYAVVVPHPMVFEVPLGYPLPPGDQAWSRFVSDWTTLKVKNGTVDGLFDHWIRGAGAEIKQPHWSVIRDVLHWVD